MTTKRTRPDRRKAMTGKPGLNPSGRPAPKIEVLSLPNNKAVLHFDNEMIEGDINLIQKCEKALMRGRKISPRTR